MRKYRKGGVALPIACDVKDRQSLENSVLQTVEMLGGLNILVNNAQKYLTHPA